MKRESNAGPCLSAVFVDYDNIYLSLKRKNDEAARRFAKDAQLWLKEIETGRLITPTNGPAADFPRRIVSNRCYGNPVPRRNTSDNTTDMNSFPFVRHHFLRAGFEIIDCPPLTAQLKNSSDIRMVMDVRDYLTHETYFDEFIIMSGDADFTPVLHRLRAHARRTVIFANDYTAAPYTAISDGEIREADLIALLLEGRVPGQAPARVADSAAVAGARNEALSRDIAAEIIATVRNAPGPVPIEALADRAIRSLGNDKTTGTNWAGHGTFRTFLQQTLPEDIQLTDQAPYFAYDVQRQAPPASVASAVAASAQAPQGAIQAALRPATAVSQPTYTEAPIEPPVRTAMPVQAPAQATLATLAQPLHQAAPPVAVPLGYAGQPPAAPSAPQARVPQPQAAQPQAPGVQPAAPALAPSVPQAAAPVAPPRPVGPVQQQAQVHAQAARPPVPVPVPVARAPDHAPMPLQVWIARIIEACQAPPLEPQQYRQLFELMSQELTENGLSGAQTVTNITQRSHDQGLEIRRDDVRFVLEVVSEADPWFEQGASPNLFAGRFRNFVVARCRGQGLNLSADELDLIDAWFAGAAAQSSAMQRIQATALNQAAAAMATADQRQQQMPAMPAPGQPAAAAGERWRDGRAAGGNPPQPIVEPTLPMPNHQADDFPRIVRSRLRG